MGFWLYMLFISLLVPLTTIGLGMLFMNKAPGNINYFFGYRTRRSMKNITTWNFAHRYCGRIWFLCGIITAPVSIIIMIFMLGKDIELIGTTVGIITIAHIFLLILTVILTERKLKQTFDDYGRRRG